MTEKPRVCVELEGPNDHGWVLVRHFGPEGIREFEMTQDKRLGTAMDELRGDDIFHYDSTREVSNAT